MEQAAGLKSPRSQVRNIIALALVSLTALLPNHAGAQTCDHVHKGPVDPATVFPHSDALFKRVLKFKTGRALGKAFYQEFSLKQDSYTQEVYESVVGPLLFMYGKLYERNEGKKVDGLPPIEADGRVGSRPAQQATVSQVEYLTVQNIAFNSGRDPRVMAAKQAYEQAAAKVGTSGSNKSRDQMEAESKYREWKEANRQARLDEIRKLPIARGAAEQILQRYEKNLGVPSVTAERWRPVLWAVTGENRAAVPGTVVDIVPYRYNSVLDRDFSRPSKSPQAWVPGGLWAKDTFSDVLNVLIKDPTAFLLSYIAEQGPSRSEPLGPEVRSLLSSLEDRIYLHNQDKDASTRLRPQRYVHQYGYYHPIFPGYKPGVLSGEQRDVYKRLAALFEAVMSSPDPTKYSSLQPPDVNQEATLKAILNHIRTTFGMAPNP